MSQLSQNTPTGRAIGWGISWNNIQGGTASNNLMTDFSYTGNTFGIAMGDDASNGGSGSDTFSDNLFYNVNGPAVQITPVAGWTGTNHVQNNTIVDTLGAVLVDQEGSFSVTSYSGNTYSPMSTSNGWMVSNTRISNATWLTDSGETGSSTISTPTYPDPTRNLNSYAVSLGMSGVSQFLTSIRTFAKSNYHPEWLAPAINDYMRAGFALPALGTGM